MSTDYTKFLAGKMIIDPPTGIEKPGKIHKALFPFQATITNWALKRGRAALFEGCGLGKTIQQLEWARHVEAHTKGPLLILAPLAVGPQTIREAEKLLGMDVIHATRDSDIRDRGVFITNYQKLEHFDSDRFPGVCWDESSIVKNQDSKTRQDLVQRFNKTPFRLACTASPSPNDVAEMGNHAELLGVMTMNEMLATFFIHDGGETQAWRLKKHAEQDFWRWMSSWCVCINRPSDIGFSDEGYDLPPLRYHEIILETGPAEGELFSTGAHTLTDQRQAKRDSLDLRIQKAAEIANGDSDQWAIWCELNSESEALGKAINDAVEIRGDDSDEHKENTIIGFVDGSISRIVSKASMTGYGVNLQNCHKTIFPSISHSWERWYQAIRRFWRFGQKNPVDVYVILSDREKPILENLKRKERDAERMQEALIQHMSALTAKALGGTIRNKTHYNPTKSMRIPSWLFDQTAA